MGSRKLFSFIFFPCNICALLSKCLLHQNAGNTSFNKMNVCILNQYWILVRFFCFVVFLFCFVVCFFFVDRKLFFSIISEMTNSNIFWGKKWGQMSSFHSVFREGGVRNVHCSFTDSIRVNLHAVSNSKMAIYNAFNILISL